MSLIETFVRRAKKRLLPFFDLTAWTLFLVSLVPLYFLNRPMVFTLVQWTAFALALAGVSVGLSRLLLPQVDLSDMVRRAREGDTAAGIVVLAIAHLMSFLFLGIVLWAKA